MAKMWEGLNPWKFDDTTKQIIRKGGYIDPNVIITGSSGGLTPSQTVGSVLQQGFEDLQKQVNELRKENKLLAQYIYNDIKKNKQK